MVTLFAFIHWLYEVWWCKLETVTQNFIAFINWSVAFAVWSTTVINLESLPVPQWQFALFVAVQFACGAMTSLHMFLFLKHK